MSLKIKIPLLGLLLLFTSGCSTAIEKIQQVTGNQIKNIEESLVFDEEPEQETKIYEEGIPKAPTISMKLQDILNDEGMGRYAGENHHSQKIKEALDGMPSGLSEEEAYAYLIGLVGENYKENAEKLRNFDIPDFEDYVKSFKQSNKGTAATAASQPKSTSVAILVDASGSMGLVETDGKKRIDKVKASISHFVQSLPQNTKVTLKAFGHQGDNTEKGRPKSCAKPETLYSGNSSNTKGFAQALQQFDATGWTPMAKAITETEKDLKKFDSPQVENMILVVTDGTDNCDGNTTASAKKLHQSEVKPVVHVVGVNTSYEDANSLKKVAKVANGEFQAANDVKELNQIFQEYASEIQKVNQPWEVRALDKLYKKKQQKKAELDKQHQETIEKVHEENQHLNEANSYIKEQEKINAKKFHKIESWIDERKLKVNQFADQTKEEMEEELKKEAEEGLEKLEENWSKGKKELAPYEGKKQKIVEKMTESKEEEQPQP